MLGWVQTHCATSFPAGERGPRLCSSSSWQLIPSHIRRSQAGAAGDRGSPGSAHGGAQSLGSGGALGGAQGGTGPWAAGPSPLFLIRGKSFRPGLIFLSTWFLCSGHWWGGAASILLGDLDLLEQRRFHKHQAPSSQRLLVNSVGGGWMLRSPSVTHSFGDD